MIRPILILLLTAHALIGFVLPLSKPCTEEEMLKPLNIIYDLVEDMQILGADIDNLKKQISQKYRDIFQHIDTLEDICGEEKNESIEKLRRFLVQIQTLEDITSAIDSDDNEKAKELLGDIDSEHVMQIFMRKYGTGPEKIEKILDVIQLVEDMESLNIMNEALTYIIDESNLNVSMKFQNIMKEQIIANKDKVDEEVILAAKMNMKEIAKKNLPGCFCGVKALRGLDSPMADQAGYEAAFQSLNDSIYSPAFIMATTAPCTHMQGICLGAIFDKIRVLELENSLVAAKTLILAKNLLSDEKIQTKYLKAKGIIKNIIENSSTFAKNLANAYSCQDIEGKQNNEYMVFYNPDEPESLFAGKYVDNPNGDKLKITVEKKNSKETILQSILIDNADYPENLQLQGNIISKTIVAETAVDTKDICEMDPKPEADICIPFSELLTLNAEDTTNKRADLFDLQVCN